MSENPRPEYFSVLSYWFKMA